MRTTAVVTAICFSLAGLATAADADAAIKRNTDIPAQSLAPALQTLVKQRDIQLVYRAELIGDRKTAGASGELTAIEALGKLLDGTGLTYSYLDDKTVTILPIASGGKPPVGATSNEQPGASPEATRATVEEAAPPAAAKEAQKPSIWERFRLAQVDQRPAGGDRAVDPNGATTDSSSRSPVEEVVVTAQKRSENIQDVPVSISAISADKLRAAEASRLSDIAAIVPGLQINSQTGQPGSVNITLRGITTADINSTTTAITVDDVPIGSSTTYAYAALSNVDMLPYDLDHIEVLKGPQGTLYGATSLGGLLKYVTTTPDLEEFSARIGGSVANVDQSGKPASSQRGVVNMPVVPGTLAVSVSAGHTYQAGFIDNIAVSERDFNHGEQDTARLTALLRTGDRFRAKVTALYNSSDYDGLGSIAFDPVLNQPIYGEFETLFDKPFRDRRNQNILISDLSFEFDFATLTSVTGYSSSKGTVTYDASQIPFYKATYRDNGIVTPGEFASSTRRLTQELRLSSPEDRKLRWIIGAFYNKEKSRFVEHIDAIVLATGQPDAASTPFYDGNTPSKIEETAGFADVTYSLSERWDIGAGVRSSHNKQDVSSTFFGVLAGGAYQSPRFNSSDSSVTYAASTRYRLSSDAMVYARVATGFRPGGANTTVGVPPTFEPDETTSYELGLKSELLERRWLLNAALFYIDWTDIHLTDRLPNQLPFLGNGGKARSEGVELSTGFQIMESLRASTAIAYTDATLRNDAPNVGAASGDPLPNTPKWSGIASLDWSHPVSAALTGNAGLAWRYVGSRISAFPDAQGGAANLDSYDALDLTAGVVSAGWRATLFVKNLSNKRAYLSYSNFGATILQPRTLGVSVDVNF